MLGVLAAALLAAAPQVLTLDHALEEAEAHQPDLRQAQEAAAAAEARVGQALAPLLPQLSGRVSDTYSRGAARAVSVGGTQGGFFASGAAGHNTLSLGVTATQLVWDFGQTLDRYKASKEAAQSQRATYEAGALQLRLTVRSAYFTARANKALLRVAKETLANESRHLAQVQGFVTVGTRPEIDLAQEKTAQANAQFQLIQADNNYLSAKASLDRAMGVDLGLDYDVEDTELPPVQGEDATVGALMPGALAARPDYAALQRSIGAQQLTIDSTKGGYWPSIGVGADFAEVGSEPSDLDWSFSASATLSWSFFEGGATRAQVQEQGHVLNQLKAQASSLEQQVRLEVEQALLAVRAAKSGLTAANEALVNARERLRLAEGRYQTGVGSLIELGDAQVALTQAEAQQIQAEYNLSTARAQLLQRLGRR